MNLSPSPSARKAFEMVSVLQTHFAVGLENLDQDGQSFEPVKWLRNEGRHGGGQRLVAPSNKVFNRGSINVSHVHYSDQPERKLDSATALSTIIHPYSPLAPSVHIHVSWTEMKSGQGYWRIMADLNPAIVNHTDQEIFSEALRMAAPNQYQAATAQGDKYFYIPALKRHRGVSHFYLEQYQTTNKDDDFKLAEGIGKIAIDTYLEVLANHLAHDGQPTDEDWQTQLAYHTLYAFQVLTLDRGTTSGLLVHDENDIGILGSIPARVDPSILASWQTLVPSPQDKLVRAITEALPKDGSINDQEKLALANIVRRHFRDHPEALKLQARGDVLPPTVANHQGVVAKLS